MRLLFLVLTIFLVLSCVQCTKITHQTLKLEQDQSIPYNDTQLTALQLYTNIPKSDQKYFEGFRESFGFKAFSLSTIAYLAAKNSDLLDDIYLAIIRSGGWTQAGVKAKSIASTLHSWIGNIPKGHWFAKLQSIGAKGIFKHTITWGTKLLPWVAGGIAIGVAGYYAYNYFYAQDQAVEVATDQGGLIIDNQSEQESVKSEDITSSKEFSSEKNQSNSFNQFNQTELSSISQNDLNDQKNISFQKASSQEKDSSFQNSSQSDKFESHQQQSKHEQNHQKHQEQSDNGSNFEGFGTILLGQAIIYATKAKAAEIVLGGSIVATGSAGVLGAIAAAPVTLGITAAIGGVMLLGSLL